MIQLKVTVLNNNFHLQDPLTVDWESADDAIYWYIGYFEEKKLMEHLE